MMYIFFSLTPFKNAEKKRKKLDNPKIFIDSTSSSSSWWCVVWHWTWFALKPTRNTQQFSCTMRPQSTVARTNRKPIRVCLLPL